MLPSFVLGLVRAKAQAAQQLPPCYALAVSGLPAREQLFNGSLCHDAGALFDFQVRTGREAQGLSPAQEISLSESTKCDRFLFHRADWVERLAILAVNEYMSSAASPLPLFSTQQLTHHPATRM